MPLSQCVGSHQHARGGAAGSEQIHVLECRNGNTLSAGIHVLECSTHMGTCVSHVPTGTWAHVTPIARDTWAWRRIYMSTCVSHCAPMCFTGAKHMCVTLCVTLCSELARGGVLATSATITEPAPCRRIAHSRETWIFSGVPGRGSHRRKGMAGTLSPHVAARGAPWRVLHTSSPAFVGHDKSCVRQSSAGAPPLR